MHANECMHSLEAILQVNAWKKKREQATLRTAMQTLMQTATSNFQLVLEGF